MRDRKRVGSRQRSLSFLSFLPRRERPLLAGNSESSKPKVKFVPNKNAALQNNARQVKMYSID